MAVKKKTKKRVKRRGYGKRKGSSFEREVCRMLSLFATRGARDDVFWRSSISGGRSTVAMRKSRPALRKSKAKLAHVAGDICAVHPDGADFIDHYFVECKHYRDMQVGHAVLTHSGRLMEFWEVAKKKAAALNKFPLLIFKQDRSPTMAASTVLGMDDLNWISYACISPRAFGADVVHRDEAAVLCIDYAEDVFNPEREVLFWESRLLQARRAERATP